MTVDFSKPIEAVEEITDKVYEARLLGAVSYSNPHFKHAVAIKNGGGNECVYAVRERDGLIEDGTMKIRNKPPQIVREVWVNWYTDGSVGVKYESRAEADHNYTKVKGCAPFGSKRKACLHTEFFDDDTTNQEVIYTED